MDSNDNRPMFVNEIFTFRVPENVSVFHRLVIGIVQAEDKDLESVLVYELMDGNNSRFHLDVYTGMITTTAVQIDYENLQYARLTVRIYDGIFSGVSGGCGRGYQR